GSTKWECLTKDNPAADSGPLFSPDGKRLAYRAQKRPGFEADRWELMVVETDLSGAFKGKPHSVTPRFDRSPESYAWGLEGAGLAFTAEEQATAPIFWVYSDGGRVTALLEGNKNGSVTFSPGGGTLAFTRVALNHPAEVFVAVLNADASIKVRGNLSRANEA